MSNRLLYFGGSGLLFLADRASKLWVERNLSAFDLVLVIPGFFNLIHSENRGMAFSLLADSGSRWQPIVLIGVSLVVMAFVGYMLWHSLRSPSPRLQRAGLTLVFGGAMGNLYDRVARGSVTDFLDLYWRDFHWATFNLADSGITVGALLLVTDMILHRDRKAN